MVKVKWECGKIDYIERLKRVLFFNFLRRLEVNNDGGWALHLPNRVCFTSGLSLFCGKNRSGWRRRIKCE